MKVKLWVLGSFVLLCCAFVLSGCSTGYFVKIDGVKLSATALEEKYEVAQELYENMGYEFSDEEMKDNLRKYLAVNMIMSEVIRKDMIAQGWDINLPKVLEEIEARKTDGEEWFQMSLDSNGLTEEELVLWLAHYEYVTREVTVTEENIKQFFMDSLSDLEFSNELGEKATARFILVDTEEEANTILEQLRNGEDFAMLVEEKTKGIETIETGGTFEGIVRGQMRPEFEEAVFAMKPGQISEPVKTAFGFYIIETLENTPGKTMDDFEEYRDMMESYALDKAKNTRYDSTYKTLLAKATIKYPKKYEYLKDELLDSQELD
ncbi:MAG: peptidylprolyl isomerase [Peptococcaceae bacterium]|nr:peptidylprolyl isomerase [Peptococcaceae bacterium]